MNPKDPQPPTEPLAARAAELLDHLRADAASPHQHASTIAQRIRQVEQWLADVPGRAETLWSCADPSGTPGRLLAFRFHRDRGEPRISWDHDDDFKDPRDSEWKPLTEAPLDIRRAAIATFPDLLRNVR